MKYRSLSNMDLQSRGHAKMYASANITAVGPVVSEKQT